MGREKTEQLSTKEAKAAAAKAAAAPPPPEEPKRKLHKIRTNVMVAKPAKEIVLSSGSSSGGRSGGKGDTGKGDTGNGGAGKGDAGKGGGSKGGGSDAGRGGGGHGGSGPAAGAGASIEGELTIVIKEWQRLPKQLLQQLCDKTIIFAKQKAPRVGERLVIIIPESSLLNMAVVGLTVVAEKPARSRL